MQIAIPIWEDRVSPLFDTARRILLIKVEKGQEQTRQERSIRQEVPLMRVRMLTEEGVDTLICGAISRKLADMCHSCGITVIAWVSGPLEEVVAAYHCGKLSGTDYVMPGCCGRRMRGRQRRGHRTGFRRNDRKER